MTEDVYFLLKQISEDENQKDFEKLYRMYFRKCFSFSFYFLQSNELAEEVVSDVFISFWKNRKNLVNIKDWDSYLYISVKNQSLLYLSQKQKYDCVSIEELFVIDISWDEDNPENTLMKKELIDILQKAVNELPERCRLIYQMVRGEGLSYKQVSKILNLSERTINTQITIAVKKLTEELKKYYQQ